MATIQEIRSQYPQYSDMSDMQLATALHAKHYSDMDFGEFSKRVGLSEAKPKPYAPSTTEVAVNAAGKAMAGIPDAILNTPNRLLNLGKAGVGTVMTAFGKPPETGGPLEIQPDPNFAARLAEKINLIRPEVVPQDSVQRGVDLLMQGAVSGALTGRPSVAGVATGAGMGTVAAGAAGSTEALTGSPAAGAIAGLVAPAAVSKTVQATGSLAPTLMRGAVKPILSDQRTGKADRAIKTMLEEGINPSKAGVEKANKMIEDLGDQVAAVLSRNPKATVDKQAVASRIQDVVDRVERTNPTPQDALRDVNKVYDDFIANGIVPKNIPVGQAQELKRGIYKVLKDKYGQQSSDTAEAQKALARGFKEEIDRVAPEAAPLNAREGDIINARNVAERRAMVEGNKNPAGLAWLARDPLAAVGFMADRSAALKGLLARGMYQTGKLSPLLENNWSAPLVTQGILAELANQRNQP